MSHPIGYAGISTSLGGEREGWPGLNATKKQDLNGPVFLGKCAISIIATVEAMVMVVVMMIPITTVLARHHDNAAFIISILAVVMVMVVMMIELGHLDVMLRRWNRRGFIDRLQQRRGVRNRLKQIGKRIRRQRLGGVGAGAAWAVPTDPSAATAPNSPAIFLSIDIPPFVDAGRQARSPATRCVAVCSEV
jgi:hypothetical protein